MFDKAQEVLKQRSKPLSTRDHYFVFRGLIKCAECGCQITAETQKGHNYYHSTKRRGSCSQSLYVRKENLARQIKDAIQKVGIDDGLFSQLMKEVNRQKALLEADKIYNERLSGSKIQEIDLQLERLLNLSVSGVISADEYREKKAQLINKKFDNLDGGNPDGDWHERFKNFLTLAHQASYIAAEANFEAQRDFLRRAVSNLKLFNKTLIVSYTSAFKIHAETHGENMGWTRGLEPPTLRATV